MPDKRPATPPGYDVLDAPKQEFAGARLVKDALIVFPRFSENGTLDAARKDIHGGYYRLFDDMRFLEVHWCANDGSATHVRKIPWAQVAQVTPCDG